MPVDYVIPPHAAPPNWGQLAQTRAQLANSAAIANAQIAAAGQRAQLEAQLTRERIAAESARQQQEIRIKEAQDQIMLQMKQRELAQAQQKIDMDLKAQAEQFAAQQEAATRIRAGEDPAKVYLSVAGRLGVPLSGIAGLAQAANPKKPEEATVQNINGQNFLRYQTSAGTYGYQHIPPRMPQPGDPDFGVSYPVYGPNKMPVPGKAMFPGQGGYSAGNVPTADLATARARVREIENNSLFKLGKRPPNEEMAKQYDVLMEDYKKAKAAVDSSLDAYLESIKGQVGGEPTTTGTATTNKSVAIPDKFKTPKGVKVTHTSSTGSVKGFLPEDKVQEALSLPYSPWKLGWPEDQ